jgi:8-oxo-dGTP pyrophosphatase MutT (NUDIX family)
MRFKNFSQFETELYTNIKGGKFWGDAGAGVLVLAASTGKFLISLRSKKVNEPLTYGVIGGMADLKNETFEEAAEREFEEETGYSGEMELKDLSIFEKFSKDGQKIFEYKNFLGTIPTDFKPKLHPAHKWEKKLLWVTFDELLKIQPKHFGLKYILDNSKEFINSELSKIFK